MSFGLFGSKPKELVFPTLPDGKYLVKYLNCVTSIDQFVVAIFEVAAGERTGEQMHMMFDSVRVRRVTREYGDLRLVDFYDVDSRADKLYDATKNAEGDTDGMFIANYRDARISTVPEHDFGKIERLQKKLSAAKN